MHAFISGLHLVSLVYVCVFMPICSNLNFLSYDYSGLGLFLSSYLSCKVRWFDIFLPSLLMGAFVIKFPLFTAFAACLKFWYVVFSFVSKYFLNSLLIFSHIQWLFKNMLFSFHVLVNFCFLTIIYF